MPIRIDGTGYIGTANNIYTDASGRVGIGTSAPENKLHVVTAVDYSTATFQSSGSEVNIRLNSTSSGGRDWRLVSGGASGGFSGGQVGFYDATAAAGRFRIDSSGRVTMPYQPCFYAFRNAGNVTGAAVFIFNDTYTNIGGHYNTTTGRFTAPVAGNYSFTNFMLTNSSSRCQWSLRKNGNAYAVGEMQAGTWQNGSLSVILTLAVNDYIDVYINSASDVGYGSGYNGLIGQLIG